MNATALSADALDKLSPLAVEYGPFFFALLFALVVPLLGQRLISQTIHSNSEATQIELAALIKSRDQYRRAAIYLMVFLVVFSVVWWSAIQIWPPPSSQVMINKTVDSLVAQRVFQGVIRGGDDDDAFIDSDNANYTTYLSPERDRIPMIIKYVIVFKRMPEKNKPVRVYYANLQTLKSIPKGYLPTPLEFCVNESAVDMLLVKDAVKGPRLEAKCT